MNSQKRNIIPLVFQYPGNLPIKWIPVVEVRPSKKYHTLAFFQCPFCGHRHYRGINNGSRLDICGSTGGEYFLDFSGVGK